MKNKISCELFDLIFHNVNKESFSDNFSLYNKNIRNLLNASADWHTPSSGLWGGRYLAEMDSLLTKKRSVKEFNIISRYLKSSYSRILDAGCGFGRITNMFLNSRFYVTGVDVNGYFLKLAKEGAKNGKNIIYLKEDIFNFNEKLKYDMVISIFTSIGYFKTEKHNNKFIEKLCKLVKNDGTLIIETINPFWVIKNYRNRSVRKLDNGTVITQVRFFDPITSVNFEKISEKYSNGDVFEGVHHVRLYYPHELIEICKKNSLKLVDILNRNGERSTTSFEDRMWLIFKK